MSSVNGPSWRPLTIWVALALGCAHSAEPPKSAPAAAAAASEEPDPPLPPFPTAPPAPPVVDHPEVRPLTVVARDVTRGFETLVASTGSDISFTSATTGEPEVRVDGAADDRLPWSTWLPLLPGWASSMFKSPTTEGYLVVRRPLPAAGEKQTVRVFLPALLGSKQASNRYRFALPNAEPQAHDPRALAFWAEALAQHVEGWNGWSSFAAARVRLLYPVPKPPLTVAAGPKSAKTKHVPRAKQGKAQAKSAELRPAAGVTFTGSRRDSSDLARLMDTTTGMASLQETLQDDRGLAVRGDEPASLPFADAKPLEPPAHPWAAMLAALGRSGPSEPLAAAVPADFYFVRFRTFADLARLRDRIETSLGPLVAALDARTGDYDLRRRYETQLGVGDSALARLLGPSLVRDLAIVGSDPYLREGSDLTLILRAHSPAAFDSALAATLAANGVAHGGLTISTVERAGVTVQIARSADGAVRQHRARVGEIDVISNSEGAIARVLAVLARKEPALADEPDFRYMLARDAVRPADVLAFLGDRFVASVIGPRQKILAARRQLALAELAPVGWSALLYGWLYGRPPASVDEMVGSGVLTRAELTHANGEPIAWTATRGAHSSWGSPAALTPLIDLPTPVKITPRERDAYRIFAEGYQNYWRAYLDPVAVRFDLGETAAGGGLGADLRVLPIISGTEYTDLAREVGRARVGLDTGQGGVRTMLGLGPDAELRKLLTESSGSLPLVGRLAFDWLGDWALIGLDDRAPKRAGPAPTTPGTRPSDLIDSLVELPLYAGVEVKSAAGAAAFMAAIRHEVDASAPGVVDWREAGKERDVPFVAVRQKEHPEVQIALYYAFCKDQLLLSLAEAALRRQIDQCVDGRAPREIAVTDNEAPQWILETDWRERGPIWWRLASLAENYDGRWNWARRTAEAVLRGAPGVPADGRRAIALVTFGENPTDLDGGAFRLTDEGVSGTVWPFVSARGANSAYAQLARAIAHARSEVSFDDEPDVKGAPHARSLHVRVRLGGGPQASGGTAVP